MVLGDKMVSVKEFKSIDLASFTIVSTGIVVLFAIIISIAAAIGLLILSAGDIGTLIYIIPTIIVGAFMIGIYRYFTDGLFFNLVSNKLKNIKVSLTGGELLKISPIETATIAATVATIQIVLVYLASILILPLMLSTLVQSLMLAGQQLIAYELYQLMFLITQPTTALMFIIGTFVITFVFMLIAVYIYNLLASNGRGIVFELSQENGMTVIDSISMMNFAINIAIIGGALSLIIGIISLISGGDVISLISNVISGIISGFISAALIAIFYNFLAPKIGKIKLELIDA